MNVSDDGARMPATAACPWRLTAALLVAACVIGTASMLVQGPLPGDVPLTRWLQAVSGSRPEWATWLSNTAKMPAVLGVLALACGMAWVQHGRAAVLLPAVAYLGAQGVNLALRALIFVPRPDATLVQVAAASADSGLPSTFALVYAAVFGVMLTNVERDKPAHFALAALAAGLILAGCLGRIVLGGHWPSQLAASALLAFGCTRWFSCAWLQRAAR